MALLVVVVVAAAVVAQPFGQGLLPGSIFATRRESSILVESLIILELLLRVSVFMLCSLLRLLLPHVLLPLWLLLLLQRVLWKLQPSSACNSSSSKIINIEPEQDPPLSPFLSFLVVVAVGFAAALLLLSCLLSNTTFKQQTPMLPQSQPDNKSQMNGGTAEKLTHISRSNSNSNNSSNNSKRQ